MKKRIKLKGRIRTYIQFTLYLGLLLMAIDAAVFMLDFRAGLLTFGFTIFYFAITLTLYFYNKPIIMNELISFATEYGQIQRKLLRDLDLPYALLDDSGKVIWTNIAFENVVHQPKGYSKSITSLFPTITRDRLPDDSGVDEAQYELEYEGGEYVAKFRKISLKEMAEYSDMIDAEGYNGYLIAVYLFDETALHIALQEVDDQSLTVGMIYLDNYEEALESVEEVRRSLLIALIDRKVNKYIASNIKSNIRELEGALNKIIAYANLEKREINIDLAEQVLRDIISPNEKKVITPEFIIDTVADHFDITPSDIVGSKRSSKIVFPRQIVMYICRSMLGTSLQNIGKYLGGRDHTTIIHGHDKIAADMEKNESLRNTVEILMKKISPQ